MTPGPGEETRFTGLPISPGVVVARVCLFQQERHEVVDSDALGNQGPDRERGRLDSAIAAAIERLESGLFGVGADDGDGGHVCLIQREQLILVAKQGDRFACDR